MSYLESLRLNYIRASYAQAEAEGKLPQWFIKQFLVWMLRVLITLLVVFPIKLLLIVPIKLIWKYSGRGKMAGNVEQQHTCLDFCCLRPFIFVCWEALYTCFLIRIN